MHRELAFFTELKQQCLQVLDFVKARQSPDAQTQAALQAAVPYFDKTKQLADKSVSVIECSAGIGSDLESYTAEMKKNLERILRIVAGTKAV